MANLNSSSSDFYKHLKSIGDCGLENDEELSGIRSEISNSIFEGKRVSLNHRIFMNHLVRIGRKHFFGDIIFTCYSSLLKDRKEDTLQVVCEWLDLLSDVTSSLNNAYSPSNFLIFLSYNFKNVDSLSLLSNKDNILYASSTVMRKMHKKFHILDFMQIPGNYGFEIFKYFLENNLISNFKNSKKHIEMLAVNYLNTSNKLFFDYMSPMLDIDSLLISLHNKNPIAFDKLLPYTSHWTCDMLDDETLKMLRYVQSEFEEEQSLIKKSNYSSFFYIENTKSILSKHDIIDSLGDIYINKVSKSKNKI